MLKWPFLTTMPTNSVLARIRILQEVLTFASFLAVLAITFPVSCLSCLSCRVCQSCPHPLDLNCLECELTSAGSNINLNVASHLLVRDQSCAVLMARCCSNSLGTRASSAAVLMSSSRVAVVVPLDLLRSHRRTSSSHFSSPAGRSCSLHRSGTRMCRRKMPCVFHHSEDPNDGPNVRAPQDLRVLLKER